MWDSNTVEDEIQRNSLEYGVAVNSDRSIPDAKTGLKPVAKRIIYDMYDTGCLSSKPHVKSARIYGSVMGRWHPHGDSSIYGAMVRLTQDWVLRYPLIDGHGNFGNILGDGPAAGRYTESRLSKIAEEGLLAGIKKKNVDFMPNYDETEEEPVTLPAIFPNLLCNPNDGIGWAMGCSWAPHNLREVAQAIYDYLDGKNPTLPGPDFPTGGVVINKNDIPSIMATGHGTVKIRGKYNIEKNNIVFYELPYGTRLEALMEEIGELGDKNPNSNIIDVRNETGKTSGLRLVIEVNSINNIASVLKLLFAKTNLQTSFSYNQIALIGKTPVDMNLKKAIEVYVNHNIDCLVREYRFDLDKCNKRLHIVDGLLKALEDIDNIIALIKGSASSKEAKENLIKKYNFSEEQAKAILDMKLAKLANLEKVEIENEKAELVKTIAEINAVLGSEYRQKETVRARLQAFVAKYGDERRTELTQIAPEPKEEKEIKNVEPEKCIVIATGDGMIKRVPAATFKVQKKNGRGIKTQGDIVTDTIRTNTIDSLLIFSDKGNVYRIIVNDIPDKNQPIKSLVSMAADENPILIYSIYRDTDAQYILFATKNGQVKKTLLSEYANIRKKVSTPALKLRDGDALAAVTLIKDEDIILVTHNGQCIRIKSTDINNSGRLTLGVKGITLVEDDYVVDMCAIRHQTDYLAIFTELGLGKKTSLTEIPIQTRAGKGLKINRNGAIVRATLIEDGDNILLVGITNAICISAEEIPLTLRVADGNQLIKGTKVTSVTKV